MTFLKYDDDIKKSLDLGYDFSTFERFLPQ